jgi:hypothetical protein
MEARAFDPKAHATLMELGRPVVGSQAAEIRE